MALDTTTAPNAAGESSEVMASVDDADDRETLIIADVTAEGAWLSVPVADAPSLVNWR